MFIKHIDIIKPITPTCLYYITVVYRRLVHYTVPGIEIVEIKAAFDDESWDGNIGSACGVNINATVTTNYIYVPHFGDARLH